MPKKRKYELVRCTYFTWRLWRRGEIWCADGRSNPQDAGRHSLGTPDKVEALALLDQLDEVRAIDLKLIEPAVRSIIPVNSELSLAQGRKLYEDHIGRTRVTGGVKPSTQKRYRTVFDKFIAFANREGIKNFNQVDAGVLNRYATYLEQRDYMEKTLLNELTVLKQCIRWLIEAGHLMGCQPIKLPLRKVESQRAYCYSATEVQAMVAHCQQTPDLVWIGDVIIALACTGLRISELVDLRWADLDFTITRITLKDESSQKKSNTSRRTTKSSRSRSFPLHPDLAPVLQRQPKVDGFVFHGPRGGRLKADTVRRLFVSDVISPLAETFTEIRDGKRFADGRLHSFRHFFVSACALKRVPEQVVMDWVGHADSAMVRHYFHLHDEQALRYMQSLDLLGAAVSSGGPANGVSQFQDEGGDAEPATKS